MKKDNKKVIETHGKVESVEPTTLEQVWGFSELSRYGTENEKDYEAKLKDMNRSDLETHARRMGVVVVESSGRLRDNLLRDFRTTYAAMHKPKIEGRTTVGVKIDPEALKVLAEGR